jgi:hypothetical protein
MQRHEQTYSTQVVMNYIITHFVSPLAKISASYSKMCGLVHLHACRTGSVVKPVAGLA